MHEAASIELGPYQLGERIGEGGSGQIYRAKGPTGFVAVKLLGPAADLDGAARARFGRELAALRDIRHPSLVALIDHGFDEELGPYLVLELLAGADLRALCNGKALCPEAAMLLLLPIAEGTAALHAAGFVHRDLKPENAIAEPDGSVTVVDLGLAWRDGMTRHTDTGAAVGSVGYMAPEQIEGQPVEGAADVWALGVMLYEWIAGKRPFARPRPAEEAAAVLVGAHARLDAADRRCAPELADLVARCLALDPHRRPSAPELVAALTAMLDWTDDPSGERAAVVADPVGYQARVTPLRVRRVERTAREALTAGQPFAAIALCDRGLAYAPDHPQLLAIIAEAELATNRVPSSTTAPVAKPSYLWLAATAIGIAGGVAVIYFLVPERHPRAVAEPTLEMKGSAVDGAGSAGPVSAAEWQRGLVDGAGSAGPVSAAEWQRGLIDKQLTSDFFSFLGAAIEQRGDTPEASADQPTTARGWLKRAQGQPPKDAVISVRHALALNPGWTDAQVALCVALAAAKDPGAVPPCDTAIRAKPGDAALFAWRARAKLDAGDAAGALPDADRAVGLDPDPAYRRVRAKIRETTGDRDGAAKDLADACQLGDAAACAARTP